MDRNQELFKQKVEGYLRLSHNSKVELAETLGLHPKVLSRKLSPANPALLTNPEVQKLVKVLAEWRAILTEAEAVELLDLMNCPPFSPEQWLQPPLNVLIPENLATPGVEVGVGEINNIEKPSKNLINSPAVIPANNLPHQLTSFIGREREINELKDYLAPAGAEGRPGYRLITLTGIGGVGKTRLSLQVAAAILDYFPDGVWQIELASINIPSIISQTIAETLGVNEKTSRSDLKALINYLKQRQLLLVLDNCEHLIEECAQLAHCFLTACPKLHILATSREVLGLPGELNYRVLPLELPEPDHFPVLDSVENYGAIKLFINRAKFLNPQFALTSKSVSAVITLCRRLDGVPLAIELAASRINLLTPEQINSRLDERFTLLNSASNRTVPSRQQTLRDMIDWSYNLLSGPEKLLFRRLAVFSGDFSLDAAAKVCWDDAIENENVIEVLSQLVNKSLVQVEPGPDGANRYQYLEIIRQYAITRLEEAEEIEQFKRRHFDWLLELAEQAYEKGHGSEQHTWFTLLDREQDNIRTALDWSIQKQAFTAATRLSGALGMFWYVRGYYSEGRLWLAKALEGPNPDQGWENKKYRTRAYNWAGTLAMMQAEFDQATFFFEKSLDLSKELEDLQTMTETLNRLGELARNRADYSRINTLLGESLDLARQLENQVMVAHILCDMGELAWDRGLFEQARDYYQQSLDLASQAGNNGQVAKAKMRLGQVARVQGNYSLAEQFINESYNLFEQLGNQWGMAVTLHRQGLVAFDRGQYNQARYQFEQSLALFQQSGDRWGTAEQLHELGRLAIAEGNLETAGNFLEKSMNLFQRLGLKVQIANNLISQGELALWQGDLLKAQRLLLEGLELNRQLSTKPGIARTIFLLAELAAQQSDYPKARLLYKESLDLSRAMGDQFSVATCSEGYARLATAEGDKEKANALSEIAYQIRQTTGTINFPIRAFR